MADEEKTEEEEGKGGGMMKIILIVNGVLLIIGIAVGVTLFMMGGDEESEEAAADAETVESAEGGEDGAPAKPTGTPIYVPLHPAFIVNFENQEQVSFLQVDIQIMTYDAAVEAALKTHMPAVRNELLLLLGGKQYYEINNREGKRALSQECIQTIQDVLKSVGEPHSIEALYFTSFVMQ